MEYQTTERIKWRIDEKGFLRCTACILRAGVYSYPSKDDTSLRNLYLPIEELQKSIETIKTAQVTVDHNWISVKNIGDITGYVIADTIYIKDNKLYTDLLIIHPDVINAIIKNGNVIINDYDDKLVLISSGYLTKIVDQIGEYEGKTYSGIQTDLQINHIGLFPTTIKNRMGEEVRILNSINEPRGVNMPIDKMGREPNDPNYGEDEVIKNQVEEKDGKETDEEEIEVDAIANQNDDMDSKVDTDLQTALDKLQKVQVGQQVKQDVIDILNMFVDKIKNLMGDNKDLALENSAYKDLSNRIKNDFAEYKNKVKLTTNKQIQQSMQKEIGDTLKACRDAEVLLNSWGIDGRNLDLPYETHALKVCVVNKLREIENLKSLDDKKAQNRSYIDMMYDYYKEKDSPLEMLKLNNVIPENLKNANPNSERILLNSLGENYQQLKPLKQGDMLQILKDRIKNKK